VTVRCRLEPRSCPLLAAMADGYRLRFWRPSDLVRRASLVSYGMIARNQKRLVENKGVSRVGGLI